MSTPGYPDYTRLSQQGGFTFFAGSGSFTNLQTLFRGYCGSWPYINVASSFGATSDHVAINMLYYSDNTFTTLTGFRVALRSSGQFSLTQYANMSDWLLVNVQSKSTNPVSFTELSIFGAVAPGDRINMPSLDVPVLQVAKIFAASEADQNIITHVNPGLMQLNFFTVAASWNLTIRHYDFASDSYLADWQTSNATSPQSFVMDWPQGDYPTRLDVTNNDAATRNFQYSLMTKQT